MLKVENIETFYGSHQELFGMSLEVEEGQMVALSGRNGMGKTTTVRSIMGLTPARSGSIRFKGQEIRNFPPYRIAQLGLGLAPEGRQIFPTLTVRENLLATAANRKDEKQPWTLTRIYELFPPLAERQQHLGHQLSGGEQQRVAIARALVNDPSLIFADEPTGNLPSESGRAILDMLKELNSEGRTIVLVTHEEYVAKVAKRVIYMSDGKVVKDERSIQ